MTQVDILEQLKKIYPNRLNTRQLAELIGCNMTSVNRACQMLLKYNFINAQIERLPIHSKKTITTFQYNEKTN